MLVTKIILIYSYIIFFERDRPKSKINHLKFKYLRLHSIQNKETTKKLFGRSNYALSTIIRSLKSAVAFWTFAARYPLNFVSIYAILTIFPIAVISFPITYYTFFASFNIICLCRPIKLYFAIWTNIIATRTWVSIFFVNTFSFCAFCC